jgi:RNA polymerase sigma-70 factor, ECF subfamily
VQGPLDGPRPGHQGAEAGLLSTDRDAFETFYQAHFGDVLRFVARRVADPYTAADLTADVLVRALEAAASYRGEGSAGAWLMGIARHVVAAEYRRAARDRGAVERVDASRLLDADDISRLEERIDAERRVRELYARVRSSYPRDGKSCQVIAAGTAVLGRAAFSVTVTW